MTNPNCDNVKCRKENGEVRVLPAGGAGNLILCKDCFEYELAFRRMRNKSLGKDAQFKTPTWESCKVYNIGGK